MKKKIYAVLLLTAVCAEDWAKTPDPAHTAVNRSTA